MVHMIRIAVLTGCLLTPVFAGELSPTVGTVEVAGAVGLNVGPVDLGNHPVFGGDMQVYLTRWVSVGAGGAWAPMVNEPFGLGYRMTASMYTYHGGVQIHIPNPSRVTPYLLGGAGEVRLSAKGTQGGVKFADKSSSAFVGHFGGGARIALARRFGVRCEVAAFKGRDTNIFSRATVGVYGQFGGRH